MWQDSAIAIAVFVITLTAVPMIRQDVTPPLSTSVPLIGGALVLVVTYATLGLWLSFVVEVLAIALWAVLLVRGIRC